jgi:hypothetical protein
MIARPKHKYFRSPKLMKLYRVIACQNCGTEDGTVCGAHANWGFGKGMAVKADDTKCASLCFSCHSMLDQGSKLTKEERQDLWNKAHKKTINELKSQGLWFDYLP